MLFFFKKKMKLSICAWSFQWGAYTMERRWSMLVIELEVGKYLMSRKGAEV